MRLPLVRRNPDLRPSPYGKNLAGMDLSGQDLSHMDLSGADLTRAKLTFANLSGADLSGANLTRAYLYGANLKGANLPNANLGEANLTRAYLYGANLTDVELKGANLNGAYLRSADLEGANLKETDLTGVDLTQALNVPRHIFLREHYILQPTSPAFNKWFGESVVVGDDKKPVVVYHGTTRGGFTQFDPSKRDPHHNAFYFTDNMAVAETYVDASEPNTRPDPAAEPGKKSGIYRLYIKLVDPMIIEGQGREWSKLSDPRAPGLSKTFELAKWAEAHGYDGVIFRDIVDDGGRGRKKAAPATVYAVFDPKAIKSATANNGSYDPNDPDIRHNPGRSLRGRRPSWR